MKLKHLQELRKASGLTQEKLADRIGINSRKLYNYERGSVEPNLETLVSFATYFGVSTDYLLGLVDEQKKTKIEYSFSPTKLGEQILALRKKNAWSRNDLAQKVGITSTYLGVIERGQKTPRFETFISLLNALNVSADSILDNTLYALAPQKACHVQTEISSLSLKQQTFVLNMLQSMIATIKLQGENME